MLTIAKEANSKTEGKSNRILKKTNVHYTEWGRK